MARVLLLGIGSEKRLAYEEKVLLDIVADYNGSPREAPSRDETNFMSSDANCANVVGGRFHSELSYESISQGVEFGQIVNEMTNIDLRYWKSTVPRTGFVPMSWAILPR